MEKRKNNILFVLLFVFAFLVIHDYAIESFDADTQHELCYLGSDFSSFLNKSNLDLASQVHSSIHTLLEINIVQQMPIVLIPLKINPPSMEVASTSYIDFVLQRPPLI
ncbi:MAG: hypothetical protein NTW78_01675 [Campylobacterales bacterium]|nr:hypothetical protein [Campylobacterales bacterium]